MLADIREIHRKLDRLLGTHSVCIQEELPIWGTESLSAPNHIYKKMQFMSHLEQEHLYVISLNTKNVIIAANLVHKGGINCSVVDARSIFRTALLHNAASLILVHNHPSGDTAPSQQDITATAKLAKAGGIIDLPVLDHVIIGKGQYTSLREEEPSLFS